MSFNVKLADGVENELKEIAEWIEDKREDFGEIFIDSFDNVIDHLGRYPYSHRIKYGNIREIQVGRFSYVVLYRVLLKTVLILKIIHTSRSLKSRYRRR
jgi:plasmid stabilization system protein ParE